MAKSSKNLTCFPVVKPRSGKKFFLYSKMIAGFFIVNKFYRVYLFWTAGPVWRLPSIVSEENSHEQHA
jgi:hypothetical protein